MTFQHDIKLKYCSKLDMSHILPPYHGVMEFQAQRITKMSEDAQYPGLKLDANIQTKIIVFL